MRTEKIVWKASSLPECVVASVILMTVFLLSVEILARLAGKVRGTGIRCGFVGCFAGGIVRTG